MLTFLVRHAYLPVQNKFLIQLLYGYTFLYFCRVSDVLPVMAAVANCLDMGIGLFRTSADCLAGGDFSFQMHFLRRRFLVRPVSGIFSPAEIPALSI